MGDRWPDLQRLESWAGEARVNLIRLVALVGFYGNHLLNMHVLGEDITADYHSTVTALTLTWSV